MKIVVLLNEFPKASESFVFNRLVGLNEDDLLILARRRGDASTDFAANSLKELSSKCRFRREWFSLKGEKTCFRIPPKKLIQVIGQSLGSRDPSLLFDFVCSKDGAPFDIAYGVYGVNMARAVFLKRQGLARKAVVSFHGFDLWEAVSSHPLRYQKLIPWVDQFFVNCGAHRQRLIDLGFPQDKISLQASPVDTEFFAGISNEARWDGRGPIELLSAGRFVEKKGMELSILCLHLLKEKGIEARLTLLGQGEMQPVYQRLIKDHGLSRHVTICPGYTRHEFATHLRQSHVFLSPNRSNQYGSLDGPTNVIKEAALAGVPVITTPVGGIPEIIRHQETGLLVHPHSPESLSQAVIWLMEHAEARAKIVAQAKPFMERSFAINRINQNFRKALVSVRP